MSESKNSNAYGVGIITVIVGMAVAIIFYQSYYLPESLEKPSVDEHILHPSFPENIIEIILGSANEQQTDNYIPKLVNIQLGVDNHIIWKNVDETSHTVTPDHRYTDSYSGDFGSTGVVKPGESYEFTFTDVGHVEYHCEPHPWMKGTLEITKQRF